MLFKDVLRKNMHSFKEAVSGAARHLNQTIADIGKSTCRMDRYMEQ